MSTVAWRCAAWAEDLGALQREVHTLRVAVMDEAAKPTGEALPWPKALFETPMVELAAHHACLSASARAKRREWGADSAEAALLLLALLRAEQQKTGAAMCSRDVQAADGVVLALAEPQKLNLPQLRQLSQIAFHLSLLPTEMKECAGALKDSARVALGWVVSAITGPVDHDPVLVAGSASDLFRTLFNLVRTQPPDPKNETAVNECGVLMSLVCDVLRARPKATPAVPELLEAQLASLQIPVVLPEDIGYKALAKEWDSILHLLEPLLHTVEYENQNLDAPVVPMVVLQKIAEASAKAQSEMKQHIFGEEILAKQIDKADPYRPLGESKDWDPNLTLPKDAPLRHHLLKLLTASHYILKRVGGDFLFAVCDDNAEEFVRITGLGGAAGLLQERNLFAAFQHMTTSAASAAEVLEK